MMELQDSVKPINHPHLQMFDHNSIYSIALGCLKGNATERKDIRENAFSHFYYQKFKNNRIKP